MERRLFKNCLLHPYPTYQTGGLRLADFSTRIQASRLVWIRHLLLSEDSFSRHFVDYLSDGLGIPSLILSKPRALPLRLESSPFYSETFKLWLRLHGFAPSSETQIRWELLWNNKRVTIEGQQVMWKSWWQAGIVRLDDIIHPSQGRFLSHFEINERFGVQSSFLSTLQLRQSIPGAWRAMISPHGRPPDEAGLYISTSPDTTLDLLSASAPSLYSALIASLPRRVSSQVRWEDSFPGTLSADLWPLLYKLPFKTVRETKIQALQFKILHRILPCRKYLKAIRIVPDDSCPYCSEPDTIIDFLHDCPETAIFWNKIAAWLRRIGGPHLSTLSIRDIVLGFPLSSPHASVINYITLFTKFFIQRQKLFHRGNLSLIEWLLELKKKLLTGKYICSLERRTARFSKWTRILEELG